ncbi:MAG: NADH-quinone oxidoreductase subunit NuoK [Cyclobacteriaceae bacterium]|nr:NADH-quinone oxidoreductase subunit NuoK [Cyclobacteriaceae bacterium]
MSKQELLFFFSAFLFCSGLLIAVTKKNAIVVLMGIELMLNAANLNLALFNFQKRGMDGQLLALFIIIVAVCEAAVGIAIILKSYHFYHSSVLDQISDLKEKN